MYTHDQYINVYRKWSFVIVDVDLPRPHKTLGRKLCGHDSTTPPLDFRSCSDAQFDRRRKQLSQLGNQHGSRSNGAQRLRPSRRAGWIALRNLNVMLSGRSRWLETASPADGNTKGENVMERKAVVISTDGACSGNPGPGGYAAVLRFGKAVKEIADYESQTTNNRMELRAVIEAISILKMPCSVLVRTDSQVVCNALANLDGMPASNWTTKTGARRANCDLLQKLFKIKHDGNHEIRFQIVKAHSGDEDNERCNFLAQEQIRKNAR